nr:MAG TPA: hypothetical protein [Caudoviricetes sp.]
MFSFARQKRTRKAPATFEAREARTRGCSPLVTPKERSKHKNTSRFAKRIFLCFSDLNRNAERKMGWNLVKKSLT